MDASNDKIKAASPQQQSPKLMFFGGATQLRDRARDSHHQQNLRELDQNQINSH